MSGKSPHDVTGLLLACAYLSAAELELKKFIRFSVRRSEDSSDDERQICQHHRQPGYFPLLVLNQIEDPRGDIDKQSQDRYYNESANNIGEAPGLPERCSSQQFPKEGRRGYAIPQNLKTNHV